MKCWYYNLTNDPRSEPLCSQEKRRSTVASVAFCQETHYCTKYPDCQCPRNEISLAAVDRISVCSKTGWDILDLLHVISQNKKGISSSLYICGKYKSIS